MFRSNKVSSTTGPSLPRAIVASLIARSRLREVDDSRPELARDRLGLDIGGDEEVTSGSGAAIGVLRFGTSGARCLLAWTEQMFRGEVVEPEWAAL